MAEKKTSEGTKNARREIEEKKPLLPPKSDFVFKKIFGDESNKEILEGFLAAALDIPREEFGEITIIDPHLKREFEDDKLGILDVLLSTKSGHKVHIEIQILETPAMAERVTFYAAKLLAGQIASGEEYEEIRKVVSIVILDYNLIKDNERYHNKFKLYDIESGSLFTDVIEIDTMELQKLPAADDETVSGKDEGLYFWLKFIGAEREDEFKMLATKSPQIEKAVGVLRRLSADEETRMQYEAREKARRDRYAQMKGSYTKGLEEGVEIGEKKGREEGLEEGRIKEKINLAKKMLEQDMAVDVIADLSGLSINEVEALR